MDYSKRNDWISIAVDLVAYRQLAQEVWDANPGLKKLASKEDGVADILQCSFQEAHAVVELYHDAERAAPKFHAFLTHVMDVLFMDSKTYKSWKIWKQDHLTNTASHQTGFADDDALNAAIEHPPALVTSKFKSKDRVIEKCKREYEDLAADTPGAAPTGTGFVCDVLRASIVCQTPEQIFDCIRVLTTTTELEHVPETTYSVIGVKNRFAHPTFTGYRDILICIQIEHVCEPSDSMQSRDTGDPGTVKKFICEIQVHFEKYCYFELNNTMIDAPRTPHTTRLSSDTSTISPSTSAASSFVVAPLPWIRLYKYFRRYFDGCNLLLVQVREAQRLEALNIQHVVLESGSADLWKKVTKQQKERLTVLKHTTQVATDVSELEFFMETFLTGQGRVSKDLNRLHYYNELFELNGEVNLCITMQTWIVIHLRRQCAELHAAIAADTEAVQQQEQQALAALEEQEKPDVDREGGDGLEVGGAVVVTSGKDGEGSGVDEPSPVVPTAAFKRCSGASDLDPAILLLSHQAALVAKEKETALALSCLAQIYKSCRRYAEALPLCQEALVICERLQGQVHLTTAREICEIGSLFYCQEMLSEAQLNFKRCFDIRKELLGIVHPDTQTALTYYADVLYDQGMNDEAREAYEELAAALVLVYGENSPDAANAYAQLANIALYSNNVEVAKDYQLKALSMNTSFYASDSNGQHESIAATLFQLGVIFDQEGQYMTAYYLYHYKALEIRLHVFETATSNGELATPVSSLDFVFPNAYDCSVQLKHQLWDIAESFEVCGLLLFQLRTNMDTAYKYVVQSLLIRQEHCDNVALCKSGTPVTHYLIGSSHNSIGEILMHFGHHNLAKEHFDLAVSIRSAYFGKKHNITIQSLNNQTVINDLIDLNIKSAARMAEQKAIEDGTIEAPAAVTAADLFERSMSKEANSGNNIRHVVSFPDIGAGTSTLPTASSVSSPSMTGILKHSSHAVTAFLKPLTKMRNASDQFGPLAPIAFEELPSISPPLETVSIHNQQLDRACANGHLTLYDAEGYRDNGQYKQALELYDSVYATLLEAHGPKHPSLAIVLTSMAQMFEDQGGYEPSAGDGFALAETKYRQALSILEDAYEPHTQEDIWIAMTNLAANCRLRGEIKESLTLLDTCLHYRRQFRSRGVHNSLQVPGVNDLDFTAGLDGDKGYARIAEGFDPEQDDLAISNILHQMAVCYNTLGVTAVAYKHIDNALKIRQRELSPLDPLISSSLHVMVLVLIAMNDDKSFEEAVQKCQQVVKLREESCGTNHPAYATVITTLAFIHFLKRDYAKAGNYLERSMEIREKFIGISSLDMVVGLNNMVSLLASQVVVPPLGIPPPPTNDAIYMAAKLEMVLKFCQKNADPDPVPDNKQASKSPKSRMLKY